MKSFCGQVMAGARFGNQEEARMSAALSVEALARLLPQALAMEVAARLPGELGEAMRAVAGGSGDGGDGGDPRGGDANPNAGMPEDWPDILPDEPFDWGVWGGLPDGEGVHYADPTREPAEEALGDSMNDAVAREAAVLSTVYQYVGPDLAAQIREAAGRNARY
jgi:hypothetical protein